MHRMSSVLDFQATKDDGAGDHQRFWVGTCGIIHAGGSRLIFDATENGRPAKGHLPGAWYANFHAAEDGSDRQDGLVRLYVCLGEIQFDAAKNGGDIAALKILAGHAALETSEDDGFVERGAGIVACGRAFSTPLSGIQGVPHQQQAGGDQKERPEIAPSEVRKAQLIELQNDARKEQDDAPEPALGRPEIDHSGKDQHQRPKAPEAVEGNYPEVIEKQGDTEQSQDYAPDKASAVGAASEPDADDHRGAPAGYAIADLAVDLVAKFFSELLRIQFVFVAHAVLRSGPPCISKSAPSRCGARPSRTELRNSTAPMKMRSSGQNDTKIRRRVGKNPA